MFRKITAAVFSLLLCVFLLVPAYAQMTTFVTDEAGLLRSEEIDTLEKKAAELKDQYGIDAVILTVDSLGGTYAQEYADDYYDYTGYGYGENDDGFLLLYKRIEKGSFKWPRSAEEVLEITPQQYQMLMQGMEIVAKRPIVEITNPAYAM